MLLRKLASIGAPTFHEERRARFCLGWLKEQGAENAYIDGAGNVIFPFQCSSDRSSIAFMAHMDVVFPEKGQIPVKEEGSLLKAPGIGDDTANLVNLLMCVKYLLMYPPENLPNGLLFAANTCEEGLGNAYCSSIIFSRILDCISAGYDRDIWIKDGI